MKVDKILKGARRSDRGAEYENLVVYKKSSLFGALAALALGLVLILTEFFAKGTLNTGVVAVCFAYVGVSFLYEGVKLRRPLTIGFGVLASIAALFCVLAFIGGVIVS